MHKYTIRNNDAQQQQQVDNDRFDLLHLFAERQREREGTVD